MVSYEKFAFLVLIVIGICLAVVYIEKDTIENFTFEKNPEPQIIDTVATNESLPPHPIIMIDSSDYNKTSWYSIDNGYTWVNTSTYPHGIVYYNTTEVPEFSSENTTFIPVNSAVNHIYVVGGGGAGSYVIEEPEAVINYNQTSDNQPIYWNWSDSNWSYNDSSTTQQTSQSLTTSYSCEQIIVNGVVTKDTCSGS